MRAPLALVLPLVVLPVITRAADLKDLGTQTLDAIDKRFARPDGLYAARGDDTPAPRANARPASIWEAGVALSALNAAARLDPARLPRAIRFADALSAYRVTTDGLHAYQPYPGPAAKDIYYDDNEWLVLAFLETYDLTRNDHYLTLAKETFAFVASGESPDLGGGIWWRTKRDSKNTCSNAPAICAALRLHQATSDPSYLQLAQRLYTWTNAHFRDPADGLYWDTLRLDGSLEKTKWTYNTALMIRANVLLHATTHDPKYLAEAQCIARAAESKWFRPSDGACTDQAQFAHLLCEALLYLHDADHDPTHLATVRRALDALAATNRNDTYPRHWAGWTTKDTTGPQCPSLISQASAARAFLVAAFSFHAPSR